MALEHWERQQRRKGNTAAAEIAKTLRTHYGDLPLAAEISNIDVILTEQEAEEAKRILGDEAAKLTTRAQRSMIRADEEARRFRHNYIGTEHVLLGLVRDDGGVAGAALVDAGVQLPKVRSAVEFIVGRGEVTENDARGMTPRTRTVLELAEDERDKQGDPLVDTSHILLGVIREGEGIAVGVMESLGVNQVKLSERVSQYKLFQSSQTPQE